MAAGAAWGAPDTAGTKGSRIPGVGGGAWSSAVASVAAPARAAGLAAALGAVGAAVAVLGAGAAAAGRLPAAAGEGDATFTAK